MSEQNHQSKSETDNKQAKTKSTSGKDWDAVMNRYADSEAGHEAEGGKPESDAEPEQVPVGLEHPSYEALEARLTDAEQRAQKHYDQWLRIQAELDNFKRRAERDLANTHKFAVEKLVLDLIPVLDSLDQGLQLKDMQQDRNDMLRQIYEGMELTYKMFLDVLGKHGIEQLNPESQAFNPEHHEAMVMQPDEDAEPNTVLKVIQKGYSLHGRLVRPARVVVSKSP